MNAATGIDARDFCETPNYALDPLLPFLLPFKEGIIWETACGSGRIVRRLEQLGFDVMGGDLMFGNDFFKESPPRAASVQVTNPPYTIKAKWIERCYQIGLPFALLVPVETIGTGTVQAMMEEHGAELLLLNKRVNFYMPNIGWGMNGKKSSAQFPTMWFCWKILPSPLVYGRITRYPDEQLDLFTLPLPPVPVAEQALLV